VAPVRFGIFVPQGWIMDLVDIKDPVEKYEAMTASPDGRTPGL